jgi:hypothetical protein
MLIQQGSQYLRSCTSTGIAHFTTFLQFLRDHVKHLTNRSSQPLAGVMTRLDFMKQFSMFATLAAASGGSP